MDFTCADLFRMADQKPIDSHQCRFFSADRFYVLFTILRNGPQSNGMGANPKASRRLRRRQPAGLRSIRRDILMGGRTLLDGLPSGGLNIAHEALDRHILAGRGDRLALRWIGRDDQIRDFSYAALRAHANRFANILAQRGIAKGDRVFPFSDVSRSSTPLRSAPSRMVASSRPCSPRSGRSRSKRA